MQSAQAASIGNRFVLKNWSSLLTKQPQWWDEVYWSGYVSCHGVVPMVLVGAMRDCTENLVQKGCWLSVRNLGMGGS